jgi:hypothetical protein
MKAFRFLLPLAFAFCVFLSPILGETPAPLKILTIGNSFANNAVTYLPEIAAAEGQPVLIGRANLGGASFEKHVKLLKAYEENPSDKAGSPYTSNFTPPRTPGRKYSLKELLEAERWDVVTIQQASPFSHQYETYEPYAGILIEYIRKHAPQAEIVIHQTWAYREDCPLFSTEGFSQEKMYEGLATAYRKLAEKYHLRIIPVGEAFQMARRSERWRFQFPDPDFDYKNPPWKAVPVQKGSLNKGWIWEKNKETGELEFRLDFKHANAAGKYLAAQVWYEFLVGRRTAASPFVPKEVDGEDATDLLKIARAAVGKSPDVARP